MLTELKEIQKNLSENGVHGCLNVIDEVWQDGGGAPVYLEDVIQFLEKKFNRRCIHPGCVFQEKFKCQNTFICQERRY